MKNNKKSNNIINNNKKSYNYNINLSYKQRQELVDKIDWEKVNNYKWSNIKVGKVYTIYIDDCYGTPCETGFWVFQVMKKDRQNITGLFLGPDNAWEVFYDTDELAEIPDPIVNFPKKSFGPTGAWSIYPVLYPVQ